MHLEQVGVGRHEQVLYWSVQTEGAMSTTSREEIPIPSTFPQGGDVDGKRVVITGAGRGLGRLLAHAFSQGGARVTLVARTEADLTEVARELPGASPCCSGHGTLRGCHEAVPGANR